MFTLFHKLCHWRFKENPDVGYNKYTLTFPPARAKIKVFCDVERSELLLDIQSLEFTVTPRYLHINLRVRCVGRSGKSKLVFPLYDSRIEEVSHQSRTYRESVDVPLGIERHSMLWPTSEYSYKNLSSLITAVYSIELNRISIMYKSLSYSKLLRTSNQ